MQERTELQDQILQAKKHAYLPKARALGTTVVYVHELMPLVIPSVKKSLDGSVLIVSAKINSEMLGRGPTLFERGN